MVRRVFLTHRMIYGYARVLTDGQSVEAQRDQLTAAAAATVFSEVARGAKTGLIAPEAGQLAVAVDSGNLHLFDLGRASGWGRQ